LIVYPGSELPLIEAMDMGAPGCITATANLNAAGVAEVIGTYQAGDVEKAKALHEGVKTFRLTVQGYAPIPAQKRLLSMWLDEPRMATLRPPLQPMSVEAAEELAGQLREKCGFDGV